MCVYVVNIAPPSGCEMTMTQGLHQSGNVPAENTDRDMEAAFLLIFIINITNNNNIWMSLNHCPCIN